MAVPPEFSGNEFLRSEVNVSVVVCTRARAYSRNQFLLSPIGLITEGPLAIGLLHPCGDVRDLWNHDSLSHSGSAEESLPKGRVTMILKVIFVSRNNLVALFIHALARA